MKISMSFIIGANKKYIHFLPPLTLLFLSIVCNKRTLESRHESNGFASDLKYVARWPEDYGVLKCFAHNGVERQKKPCVVRVIQSEDAGEFEGCVMVINI